MIYLSAEDDEDELHRRCADIGRHEGSSFADMRRLTFRSVAGEDALLAAETPEGLCRSWPDDRTRRRGGEQRARLRRASTPWPTLFPANENDRAKARAFIGMLRGLALRRNCAVLVLAHPSLTGLSSGSGTSGITAWSNSVRSRLYLERPS